MLSHALVFFATRIRHENVVRLLGAGTEPEQFLVITRLDGGTLAQRCNHGRQLRDRRGRFNEKKPFSYMEASAVSFLFF